MNCGICNSYQTVPVEASGAQSTVIECKSCNYEFAVLVFEKTYGLQQGSQDILKELLQGFKLWFYRGVGKEADSDI